jgi:hypothetical protein
MENIGEKIFSKKVGYIQGSSGNKPLANMIDSSTCNKVSNAILSEISITSFIMWRLVRNAINPKDTI